MEGNGRWWDVVGSVGRWIKVRKIRRYRAGEEVEGGAERWIKVGQERRVWRDGR